MNKKEMKKLEKFLKKVAKISKTWTKAEIESSECLFEAKWLKKVTKK